MGKMKLATACSSLSAPEPLVPKVLRSEVMMGSFSQPHFSTICFSLVSAACSALRRAPVPPDVGTFSSSSCPMKRYYELCAVDAVDTLIGLTFTREMSTCPVCARSSALCSSYPPVVPTFEDRFCVGVALLGPFVCCVVLLLLILLLILLLMSYVLNESLHEVVQYLSISDHLHIAYSCPVCCHPVPFAIWNDVGPGRVASSTATQYSDVHSRFTFSGEIRPAPAPATCDLHLANTPHRARR